MILIADIYRCSHDCERCGDKFLSLGKVQFFCNTEKGRKEAKKLKETCGLIKEMEVLTLKFRE